MDHRLKKKLAKVGLSQLDLALATGIHQTSLSIMLSGQAEMSADIEKRIKKIIKNKVNFIVKNQKRLIA